MKLSIVAGATSQSTTIFCQDSSKTTGAGLTGLVFNTSGLTAYYTFTGTNAGSTSITLATLAAVNSAFSSGGFKEIDATNMPGCYRLDLPNAALATSKGRSVVVYLQGAANLAPVVLEIELTGWDNQDAVHGGLSALPNTACASNASLLTVGTGTAQINAASGKVPATLASTDVTGNVACDVQTIKTQTVTCAAGVTVGAFVGNATHAIVVDSSGFVTYNNAAPPTAAAIATAVWQDTTAGDFANASSPGKILVTQLGGAFTTTSSSVFSVPALANAPTGGSAPTVSQIATAVWEDLTAGGDFGTAGSIGLLLATNINATISSRSTYAGGAVASVTAGVTVSTNNDKTGYSLSVAPPTAAAIATAVWTDTTGSDFTTVSSPGKILQAQLGGAFTTASSSVFSTASLANAPSGGGGSDPWATALPGSYAQGTAGYIVGHQLAGTFTTATSSIFTVSALENAPTGSGGSLDVYAAARIYGPVDPLDANGNQVFRSPPNASDGGGVAKVLFGQTTPRGGRTITLNPPGY